MKKSLLLSLMMCFLTLSTYAGDGTEKFYFGVTSEQTVSAVIYDGMNLELNVPATDVANVNISGLTAVLRMQQIPALGIEEQCSHTSVMATGLDNSTVNLANYLGNVYDFTGTKLVFTVKANGTTQSFRYDFDEYDGTNNKLTATPNSETAAMATWNLMASQMTASTITEDNHILIKSGSYVQVGGEKLAFTSDHEMLSDAEMTADELRAAATTLRGHISVADAESGNIIYLAQGSTVFIGTHKIVLNDNLTLTLTNNSESDPFDAEGVLSKFYAHLDMTAENNNLTNAIKDVVKFCNKLVALIDDAEVNYLTINIGNSSAEPDAPTPGTLTLIRGGLTAGYYYTVCMPYGVDSYQGGTFYEINQKVGDGVELISVSSLAAGTPYVVIPTGEEVSGYFNENKASAPLENRGLIGTFTSMQVPTTGNYYVFGDQAIHPVSTTYLAANRAYIDMDAVEALTAQSPSQVAGRHRVVVNPNNAPTGVESIQQSTVGIQKELIDGQLIIIHDGVKYNAQGAVIE